MARHSFIKAVFVKPPKIKRHTHRRNRPIPQMHYVYAWFKNDEILPFYIGKGTGCRAWDRHIDSTTGKDCTCERIARSAEVLRIKIIKDGLLDTEATLLEWTLIHFLVGTCGVPMANRSGMWHESPILTSSSIGDPLALV